MWSKCSGLAQWWGANSWSLGPCPDSIEGLEMGSDLFETPNENMIHGDLLHLVLTKGSVWHGQRTYSQAHLNLTVSRPPKRTQNRNKTPNQEPNLSALSTIPKWYCEASLPFGSSREEGRGVMWCILKIWANPEKLFLILIMLVSGWKEQKACFANFCHFTLKVQKYLVDRLGLCLGYLGLCLVCQTTGALCD